MLIPIKHLRIPKHYLRPKGMVDLALLESLIELGQVTMIDVVQDSPRRYTIIDGVRRFLILRALGKTTISCVIHKKGKTK